VNLSPADLPKEGSHFDLPIALALLAALDILPKDDIEATVSLGELSLDGTLVPVAGALPAALAAAEEDRTLVCPRACGRRGRMGRRGRGHRPASLAEAIRHFTGQGVLAPASPGEVTPTAATCATSPTCAARNAPNARSKSRRRGATTS
jgi:magnesium chelatase family protein